MPWQSPAAEARPPCPDNRAARVSDVDRFVTLIAGAGASCES